MHLETKPYPYKMKFYHRRIEYAYIILYWWQQRGRLETHLYRCEIKGKHRDQNVHIWQPGGHLETSHIHMEIKVSIGDQNKHTLKYTDENQERV